MAPSRRVIDRALIAAVTVLAVMSVIILTTSIRHVEAITRNLSGNPVFYAGQIEYDTLRFLDTLDQFRHGESEVSADDVRMRFDILWSRVFLENPASVFTQGSESYARTLDALQRIQAILLEADAAVLALDAGDRSAAAPVAEIVRRAVPIAHELVLEIKDDRALFQTEFLRAALSQAYLTVALIVGMAVLAGLGTYLLRRDGQVIQRMNQQLEDRVKKRTIDLVAANTRLADEVAERKRSQALAEEREARLQQAAQLAQLGYYVWNFETDRCELCSDLHAARFDLTPEAFAQRTTGPGGMLQMVHREDRAKVEAMQERLRRGETVEIEYRIITPNGVRRLRQVARPAFDAEGNVVREVGSTIDVTDRYETELKLFEAQRMDSIGKMTGGVAHDFNNLLAVILGNLELLREVPDSDERDEMIEDAIAAALRGRDLTMNMLSFARRAPLDPTEIDLTDVVTAMEGILRRTLPENIHLRIDLAEGLPTVMADHSLTESALLNLVINARDAMPEGGELTITTGTETLDRDALSALGSDAAPGSFVRLDVVDTGRGIQPELMENIFEPFFTTKAITKNSGLGLSMVQGFIQQTGGAISVESEPGRGARFSLYFRASTDPAVAAEPETVPEAATAPDAAGVRVLLVEDAPTVRRVLARQLEQSGMQVVTAAQSDEAEEAFAGQGPFDIVVSDVVMPGELQGPALVARLRQSQPDLPAVFLSGYPQEAAMREQAGDGGADPVLMKPISRDELIAAIHEALESRG